MNNDDDDKKPTRNKNKTKRTGKRNEMKQKRMQAGSRIRMSKNAGRKPDAMKNEKREKVRTS